MLPLKKILCPTDFSEASYEGLRVAEEIALHFSAELCVVHVIPPIPTSIPPTIPAPVPSPAFDLVSYQQELEEQARRTLQDVADRKISKDLRIKPIIAHGAAADEIERVANDENAGIVVIATHGQTGWRRIMYGSVAEKVVRISSRPVLTVPIPDEEE